MISIDKEFMRKLADRGKRIDNREAEEYRRISIERNVITSAEGSAKVCIGNTQVVAGIKMDVGTPFADTPDEGVMMVAAELLPLASHEFEPGPPGEQAIELARVVDRAIRESKAIDFSKLCITPKEKVWMVYIDMDVINDDGNLIDTACLAAVAALLDAKMPELNDDKRVVSGSKTENGLPIEGKPISNTFGKTGSMIVVDPKIEEMNSLDARLTIGSFDKNGFQLCSMQKGGPDGFTLEEIDDMIDLSEKKSRELRAML